MALSRYVLTAAVTVPAGAFTSDVTEGGTPGTVTGTCAPANFGTGSQALREVQDADAMLARLR